MAMAELMELLGKSYRLFPGRETGALKNHRSCADTVSGHPWAGQESRRNPAAPLRDTSAGTDESGPGGAHSFPISRRRDFP